MNFPLDRLESKLICGCVLFSSQTRLRLCFRNKHLSDSVRDTSCLWFQTKAAPELWMVVSSGWGFLGKRRGCWHRLSGAEGSPHRVPVGAPPGKVKNRQETFKRQSRVYHTHTYSLFFFSFLARTQISKKQRHTIWTLIQLATPTTWTKPCSRQDYASQIFYKRIGFMRATDWNNMRQKKSLKTSRKHHQIRLGVCYRPRNAVEHFQADNLYAKTHITP